MMPLIPFIRPNKVIYRLQQQHQQHQHPQHVDHHHQQLWRGRNHHQQRDHGNNHKNWWSWWFPALPTTTSNTTAMRATTRNGTSGVTNHYILGTGAGGVWIVRRIVQFLTIISLVFFVFVNILFFHNMLFGIDHYSNIASSSSFSKNKGEMNNQQQQQPKYYHLTKKQHLVQKQDSSTINHDKDQQQNTATVQESLPSSSCNTLRRYPPHRYYGLDLDILPHSKQPEFLTKSTEYIYGEWPILLSFRNKQIDQEQEGPLHQQSNLRGPERQQQQQLSNRLDTKVRATKICIDQSSWHKQQQPGKVVSSLSTNPSWTLPFADGTNPSILTIHRIQQEAPSHAQWIIQHYPTTYYVVSVCMTNSQCQWKDNPTQQQEYHLSLQLKPDTIRTVLLLLNEQGIPLGQATIQLVLDTSWGRKVRMDDSTTNIIPALDDARLFIYNKEIYLSYREGPAFGYETQVLNPIRWDQSNSNNGNSNSMTITPLPDESFAVVVYASQSITVGGGRNMALLIDNNNNNSTTTTHDRLKALTWVDPVTVVDVDTTPDIQKKKRKKIFQHQQHRMLVGVRSTNNKIIMVQHGTKTKKSHIHGTNAFMVPIPVSDSMRHQFNSKSHVVSNSTTFLGIAHFHRPNDRNPNMYARFGHHYTHAFYTITRWSSSSSSSAPSSSYVLTMLSSEFLLPSIYNDRDGEIIQFMSGLEYDENQKSIVIAYGINDCEAALITFPWEHVQKMLRPVEIGKQVVDYMNALSNI